MAEEEFLIAPPEIDERSQSGDVFFSRGGGEKEGGFLSFVERFLGVFPLGFP